MSDHCDATESVRDTSLITPDDDANCHKTNPISTIVVSTPVASRQSPSAGRHTLHTAHIATDVEPTPSLVAEQMTARGRPERSAQCPCLGPRPVGASLD